MQTVGRSPDISVMWRTEYYAGAGYIRHVAVKRLMNQACIHLALCRQTDTFDNYFCILFA